MSAVQPYIHSPGHSRGSPNIMTSLSADSEAPQRTPAELAREKKLRDDPMATVHGPLFVTCKRCGSRIKLSPKSSYDPFHWTKHRERCLRKPVGMARAPRRSPKDIYISPAKKSPASSSISNTDGDNATPPPLTPDDDRPAGSSDIFRRRSLPPNIDDPDRASPIPAVREFDSAFVDYLHRSQRPPPKHLNPVLERWQSWNWSELRPPTWMANHDHRPVSFIPDDHEDCDIGYNDALLSPAGSR